MTCSPARLLANRQNAAKSSGPKSPEGKARSRSNALKHGFAAEVVVPVAEEAEVARRESALTEELAPGGELGRILVRRVAILSTRLDRCARHDAAMARRRVEEAGNALDDERTARVDALASEIADNPARTVARLGRTPEGLAWLIRAWLDIKGELLRPAQFHWCMQQLRRIDHLMGRAFDQYPLSPIDPFCRAIWGDDSGLDPELVADLDPSARSAWAREQVGRMIDAEVAALEERRSALLAATDWNHEIAEAAERALFDAGRDAVLARKYEAAAERGLYRALRSLKEQHQTEVEPIAQPVEADPAIADETPRPEVPAKAPAPPLAAAPLGSFVPGSSSRRGRGVAPSSDALDVTIGRVPARSPARA